MDLEKQRVFEEASFAGAAPGSDEVYYAKAWRSSAKVIGKRLGDFSEEVEQVFLSISTRLKEFSDRSSEISRMSLAASKVMGGDEIRGAITGIRGMVDNLRGLFKETEVRSDDNVDRLRQIEQNLDLVERDLEALLETSRNLRMLGLSTKIQSTRTGQNMSTFMQLGGDISQMSGVILGKAEELMGQAAQLSDLVEDVFGSLRQLRIRQAKQISGVLGGARQVIDSLEEISSTSQDESRRIAHWSMEIEKSLQAVVVAIQFHDITRQALEKIHKEIIHLKDAATSSEASGEGAEVHFGVVAARTCRTQAARLRETAENLVSAVRKMIDGFNVININIADMAQVTGKAGEASSRFLDQLERGMGSVTSFLSEVVESGREMSGAMNSLAGTVAGMSAFTQDIESISSDVELISLNARIKASQTGSQGAGMGVIAGAVHKTASASNDYRRSFQEKLQSIMEAAGSLKNLMDEGARKEESKLEVLVRELGVLLGAIRHMQERLLATLRSMESKGRELSENIVSCVHNIRLQVRTESLVVELAGELDKMALEATVAVPVSEFVRLSGGRSTVDEVQRTSAGERLRMIEEYFAGKEPRQGFEVGETASMDQEAVLFHEGS